MTEWEKQMAVSRRKTQKRRKFLSWVCMAGMIIGLILNCPLPSKQVQAEPLVIKDCVWVDSNDPDAFATLDEAIRIARTGDTIYIANNHFETISDVIDINTAGITITSFNSFNVDDTSPSNDSRRF